MIKLGVEQLEPETKIGIRLLPPEGSLPRKFKVCAEVEIQEQKAIKKLTDNDRLEVEKKTAEIISGTCPRLGSILITIDGVREGFVNVGIYTNSLSDINVLRDAEKFIR